MQAFNHKSRQGMTGLSVAFALLLSATAQARVAVARLTPSEACFAAAAELRTRLEAKPAAERSRGNYEQTLDAFRAVYHRWPEAGKAPAAVEAVAELLAEEGRGLRDEHAFEAARGQYEFLLKQYPTSPQVAEALLNEGELCRNELGDKACARAKLRTVLKRFPDSSYAEQAGLDLTTQVRKSGAIDLGQPASSSGLGGDPGLKSETWGTRIDSGLEGSGNPGPKVRDLGHPASSFGLGGNPGLKSETWGTRIDSGLEGSGNPGPKIRDLGHPVSTSWLEANAPSAGIAPTMAEEHVGGVVRITGMRHWSNPTSTRIAIDLSGKVEYEASRVPNPDRIFFDLHGARLAAGLNGREVEVIDDGYLNRIRAAQYRADVTRVVLDVTEVSEYSAFLLPNPWRLIIDIHGGKPVGGAAGSRTQPSEAAHVGARESSAEENTEAEVAGLSNAPTRERATTGPTSAPVSAEVSGVVSGPSAGPAAGAGVARRRGRQPADASVETAWAVPEAAEPTADGERSLVRALGLKVGRIVIDAGHGGHDSGTLGPGGIEEKDVVLDVALRTGRLLHRQLGAQIVYTRDDDTFIPLETRTAIANKAQADLFLSIHANSSAEPEARGVETYYLNFTTDQNALEVAARENALSSGGVHELSDLVKKIALKDKIDESREFAADVDESLYADLEGGNADFKDRGVKKAPFVVLIGAQMPSVLAEISFLTNPEDAAKLRQSAWRERIAESLAAGVERYLRGLSGVRPASAGSGSLKAGGGE